MGNNKGKEGAKAGGEVGRVEASEGGRGRKGWGKGRSESQGKGWGKVKGRGGRKGWGLGKRRLWVRGVKGGKEG